MNLKGPHKVHPPMACSHLVSSSGIHTFFISSLFTRLVVAFCRVLGFFHVSSKVLSLVFPLLFLPTFFLSILKFSQDYKHWEPTGCMTWWSRSKTNEFHSLLSFKFKTFQVLLTHGFIRNFVPNLIEFPTSGRWNGSSELVELHVISKKATSIEVLGFGTFVQLSLIHWSPSICMMRGWK